MSQGNRRMSQIPMRKSHSNASLDGSNFQNSSQMQAMNPNGITKLTGRASSIENLNRQSIIDRPSLSRASSIGCGLSRPSIGVLRPSIGTALKQGEKIINLSDLAKDIYRILIDLDYKQAISVKDLQIPSSTTFYFIFEFFLKNLGFGNDIWNADILIKRNHLAEAPPKNKNQQASQSQGASSQAQIIAQNKARLDLIIFYLSFLKFNNIPKLNVLQTMTTPKNWAHMLQILHFLANNCWFMVIYSYAKINKNYDQNYANNNIIYDYLKQAYSTHIKDDSFLGSERHEKMKLEFHKKYERQTTKSDLKELTKERDLLLKQHEHAVEAKRNFDDSLSKEQELIRILNEEERLLALSKTETDDIKHKVKVLRIQTTTEKNTLNQMEEELALKDIEYDKQLASGKKMDNLVNRHAQKVQQLDNLQNTYVELGNQKEDLQKKLLKKSGEVAEKISGMNDLVNKIKLSSSVSINEFPQIELLDFHKKTDIIQRYKNELLEIRKNYNTEMCKLPEILEQCKEEKKLFESKIQTLDSKNTKLETEIAKQEYFFQELKRESEETINVLKKQVNLARNALLEKENIQKNLNEEINLHQKENLKAKNELVAVSNDLQKEMQMSQEKAKATCIKENEKLAELESQYIENMQSKIKSINEINNFLLAKKVQIRQMRQNEINACEQ